jgi:hypothetical protein
MATCGLQYVPFLFYHDCMAKITPDALTEHLEAALMVAPASTLECFTSANRRARRRAAEWLADHLAVRFRHHNIGLVDASLLSSMQLDGDGVATELQDVAPELAVSAQLAGPE